jgi:hypothetical protein
MTQTGFRMQLVCGGGALGVEGGAEFYPERSWVRPERKTDRLLAHEQGHFDITEVFARRMRKGIREANIGCNDEARAEAEGKRILKELDAEWGKAERAYDAETKNGIDLARQTAASERIARELAELSGYR